MIVLTETQESHLESLKWLISDDRHRAEGRTFLLAMAFISKALDHPGRRVYVFDHWHTLRANVEIVSTISHVFNNMVIEDMEMIMSTHTQPPYITVAHNFLKPKSKC
jgi:hypothetical protein